MTATNGSTEDSRTYDIIVLGAGPAGENLAQYAIEGTDLTAVLVEGELVGGECSYYACMPSKALLRPLEVAATAAHLPGVRGVEVDRDALLARRDKWVSHYDDASQVSWAEGAGIDVVRGHGRLTGERTVGVETSKGLRQLVGRRAVVIATGSTAVVPEMYAACSPWGSPDATGVVEIPERLVIIGGGVVACEAAVWMAGLGSKVTMLVQDDRLLSKVEPEAADLVRASLGEAGIDVRLGVEVTSCEREGTQDNGLGRIHGGPVRLAAGEETIEADEILVAAGRRPRLGGVGLGSVGLDEKSVLDGELPDWLHVVGDASGDAPLTHWGKYRARALGERLAADSEGRSPASVPENVPVPQVIFTDPEVAAVGMTADEAHTAYANVVVATVKWDAAAGAALLRDDATGMARLVVDGDTGLVLGATFVGPGAGELLHAATIAIVGKVPVHLLRHAVPSYPTASELWLRLLEDLPVALRQPQEGNPA